MAEEKVTIAGSWSSRRWSCSCASASSMPTASERPADEGVGYTVKEAGYPYMASLFFFAGRHDHCGRLQDKLGPSKVGIAGGVLLALGAAVAGMMYKSLGGLIFGYGVLGGLGVGFAYVTPIGDLHQVVPDNEGRSQAWRSSASAPGRSSSGRSSPR